jgi:hypothetical protein
MRRRHSLVPVFFAAALLAACKDSQSPPVPGSLTVADGNQQTAAAGTALPTAPAVLLKDTKGRIMKGVDVTFAVASGGGTLAGAAIVKTGSDGVARAGAWTLGTTVGVNTLKASSTGVDTLTLTATGTPGPATQMAVFAGNGQTSSVSAAVPIAPAVIVRDQFNNPVAGTAVTFSVTSGDGSITGAAQTTGADGVARVGSWLLGATAGTNTLTAEAAGLATVNFTATGTVPLVFTMTLNGGDGQTAPTRWTVGEAPSVKIVDQFGNPASGKTVTFSVASGGGTVTGGNTATNVSGVAKVFWWRLGAATGANSLTATAAGVTPITFTATATTPPVASGYNINIAYIAAPTAAQHQAVIDAVTRWQEVITGDISDFVNFSFQATGCSPAFVNETIDDVLIQVDFRTIDGVGNILGQAGPCLIRLADQNSLTGVGLLRLDADDLANMVTDGTIGDVVLHEIGHVLGFGTLWNQTPPDTLRIFAGTDSVTYTGTAATAAFLANGGNSFAGPPVPLENCKNSMGDSIPQCGAGTRDSHWREAVLGRELMTGYVSQAGTSNPLSAITIQSLADLGYTVNAGASDAYTVGLKPIPGVEPVRMHLKEAMPDWTVQTLPEP